MSAVLELREVALKGRGRPRLSRISLRLEAGERVALIGISGSGKSSLIRVANGTLKPSAGQVRWFGDTPACSGRRRRRQQRRIGTLWQDLRLIEELTVQQNLNSGCLGYWSFWQALFNLLGPMDSEANRQAMDEVDLEENLLPVPVQNLSGGQRQRVAMARLLRQRADLLLLDEPLAHLDPRLARQMLGLFMDQTTNGAGLLLSLHRPDWLAGFDRVVGLEAGCCVLDAPADSLSTNDLEHFYNRSSDP